jgi:hypothetical protein
MHVGLDGPFVPSVMRKRRIKDVQWNLLKKNLVKTISRLRSQDKKAPKFSHFIKITLLRNVLLKK